MESGWDDALNVAREAMIKAGVLQTMMMDGMTKDESAAFLTRYHELSEKLRTDLYAGKVTAKQG